MYKLDCFMVLKIKKQYIIFKLYLKIRCRNSIIIFNSNVNTYLSVSKESAGYRKRTSEESMERNNLLHIIHKIFTFKTS